MTGRASGGRDRSVAGGLRRARLRRAGPAHDRRDHRRSRTLWMVGGTALVVTMVAVLPQVWHAGAPSPTGGEPNSLALTAYRVCPSTAHQIEGDGSALPDPQAAMAAVLAAGARVAPA